VFAYLKPFPALADFLVGLSAMPINSLVYISGTHPVQIEKLRHCRIQFADGPVDLKQAAERCHLAVTNATHGTGVAMLLAGKPLVHLPMYLEQYLFAQATERLGASVTVAAKNAKAALQAIEHVLNIPRYTEAARCFADKHRNDRLEEIYHGIVDELELVIAKAR
jgi:UDP:flavonoid glycosyltransferase YjiC (YdhE family)